LVSSCPAGKTWYYTYSYTYWAYVCCCY
jgi:hypothetical protein